MMSKIDEIFKKVLNNREIFNTPYDKNKKCRSQNFSNQS